MVFRRRHGLGLVVGLTVLGLSFGCVGRPRYQPQMFGSANYPSPPEILSGRFERNPPEFYAVRLARLRAGGVPNSLGAYEAIAVALDRLGRHDEAIYALKAQAGVMHRSDSPATSADWFVHHADYGAFLLHRWIARGPDWRLIGEVKAARDHLTLALKIRPHSADAREEVLLDMINWIIECARPASRVSFVTWLARRNGPPIDWEIEGLLDLVAGDDVRLPVDIYDGLEYCYATSMDVRMAAFATLRKEEFLSAGNAYLVTSPSASAQARPIEPRVPESYWRFRDNAEENQALRVAFMAPKLRQGLHPDIDPHFWDGFSDLPALERFSAPERLGGFSRHNVLTSIEVDGAFLLGFIIGAIAVVMSRRRIAFSRIPLDACLQAPTETIGSIRTPPHDTDTTR